jgi:site-specific DNA recombinase
MALRCRVDINPDRIDINLSRGRLAELLAGQPIDLATRGLGLDDKSEDVVTLTVPARLKRVGREMRMLVEASDDRTTADLSLLRIIARAHDIQARLIENDVAREEQVSAAYIYVLLRLPWLAPDITAAILNGQQPPQLTAKKLMRLTPRLPVDWAAQRSLLGFR